MTKTPKQRFNDFISRRDRSEIPVIPMIAGDHAAFIAGYTLREVCQSGKKLADALEHTFRIYSHDLVIVFSDVTVEAEALGAVLEFSDDRPPFIVKYPDVFKVKPANPCTDGRMPELLFAAERCCERIGSEVTISCSLKDPFSLSALIYEPNAFFRDLLQNPHRIREILAISLENQLAYLREIIAVGALPFIGAPLASGSLISPKIFEQFVVPSLKPLFELIHQHSLPVCIHICGDSQTIIDSLIALKPDIISVDQLDLPRCVREYPESIFMGNLSTTLLLQGPPEHIFSATTFLLDSIKEKFIPATGCDVPMKTPPEHIHTMIQAVRTASGENRCP